MNILTRESTPAEIEKLAGGKGRHLFMLTDAGLDVPPWAILGIDVFQRIRSRHGLDPRIDALLDGLTPEAANERAGEIEQLILGLELDETTLGLVAQALDHIGEGAVAVRSSGGEEDSRRLSYAGQFASYLNVSGTVDEVADHLKRCWASAYSSRSLHYRLQHRMPARDVEIAVIVQRLVPADVSGVVFTVNPAGRPDEMVIASVYGLGEGLVSGAVDADTVVVDRADGAIRSEVVGEKHERYEPAPAKGCLARPVDRPDRERLSLSKQQIALLVDLGRSVEALSGTPQDLEWAFADGRPWLLQARPITTTADAQAAPIPQSAAAAAAQDGELRIWDNSNIIESFGGATAPLTFSFAAHVYQRVFTEQLRALGVPERYRDESAEWLRNLLGYFDGRVYYNLLNWYRLVGVPPLYRLNRRVFELAIGAEPIPADLADTIRPFRTRTRGEALRLRARITWRFLLYFFTIQRTVRRFLRHFYDAYEEFETIDYDRLPGERVYERFTALERQLISRWGPMGVLETVVNWSFGFLMILTRRWLPAAPEWFYWKVASPSGAFESAEPARVMFRLAAQVEAEPALRELILSTPAERLRDALDASGFHEFGRQVDDYIDRFGYRSLNELKLEDPDLREEPAMFFPLLTNALATGGGAHAADETNGVDVERIIAEGLGPFRRACYAIVRRKARKAFVARERVRFCRTRAFGITRRMFRAMGRDLAASGALDDERDIFYLTLDELRGACEGRTPRSALRPIVGVRRKLAADHADSAPPSRFVTHGPLYAASPCADEDQGDRLDRPAVSGEVLTGVPAGPGTAEGQARVITAPDDVGGGILVTYRTDPGWVAVLPSASALLIERGSPLTHVAIVARELGVPTVVQVKDLTRRVSTGMRLHVDGGTGRVIVH